MNLEFSDLKIDKRIVESLKDYNVSAPNVVQRKILKRLNGGQDFTLVANEGLGKTTALLIGIISKLKYAKGETPRALVLCPSREHVEAINEQFIALTKHTDLRSLELFAGRGIQGQKDMAFDGLDVVFGTPDRVLQLYLKSGINFANLSIFALDDADLIVKQGLQSNIWRLAESLPACQHVVFSAVYHDKLDRLTEAFLFKKEVIEVEENLQERYESIEQYFFHVPNFATKLNLLNTLLRDPEALGRVVVFVNTKFSADKIYKTLSKWHKRDMGILKGEFDQINFSNLQEFAKSELRILVAANEVIDEEDLLGNPNVMLHFDLPEAELLAKRLKVSEENKESESVIFATDLELATLKSVEKITGKKMEKLDTPEGIEEENKPKKKEAKIEEDNGAFQEKKAKNQKDYNYNLRQKRQLSGKKQKRRKG